MSGRDVKFRLSIEHESTRILDFFTCNPGGICSAVKEVVRNIMLRTDGQIIIDGKLYDITAKQLGGGVYRLTLKYSPSNNPTD